MNDIATTQPQTAIAHAASTAIEPGALLGAMLELARDPAFDVVKLEALANLQLKMEDREADRQLTKALQQAQAEIPQIEKRGLIPKKDGKSIPFATEQDIDNVLRPICEKYGFTLHYTTETPRPGLLIITTTLRHGLGASISASVPLPIDEGPGRNATQSHGSTMSYGRRYGKEMIFNIVRKGADDDGNAAGKKFISPERADELRALAASVKRQEGQLLDQMFGGTVRTMDEVPEDAYLPVKNMLLGIQRAQQKKA
jgi:ERF superfamily